MVIAFNENAVYQGIAWRRPASFLSIT